MNKAVQIYNADNAHFEAGDNTVFYKKRVLILQGDIALLPVDVPDKSLLNDAMDAHDREVTLGAATGHPHLFQGEGVLYALPKDKKAKTKSPFCVALLYCDNSDGRLVHTREGGHCTHQVLPGFYEVILQHQIQGEEYTRVLD